MQMKKFDNSTLINRLTRVEFPKNLIFSWKATSFTLKYYTMRVLNRNGFFQNIFELSRGENVHNFNSPEKKDRFTHIDSLSAKLKRTGDFCDRAYE